MSSFPSLRSVKKEWGDEGSEPNDLMLPALAMFAGAAGMCLVGFLPMSVLGLVGMPPGDVVIATWAGLWTPFLVVGALGHVELGIVNFLAERGVGSLALLTANDYLCTWWSFLAPAVGGLISTWLVLRMFGG